MTKSKIQMTNQCQSPNIKGNFYLTLSHLDLFWHLGFVIWHYLFLIFRSLRSVYSPDFCFLLSGVPL
jgi:hypothetical protein